MASEVRLIDANALKWKIGQVCLYVASLRCGKTIISKILESYRNAVFEEIDNAPTVDAVEVVHGRWVKKTEDYVYYYACSECGEPVLKSQWGHDFFSDYCPNCGAKMDGDGNG